MSPSRLIENSELTPLEVATSFVAGRDTRVDVSAHLAASSPVAALEDVLLEALSRPPCVVSFSGGRDSSALLAVVTRLARREKLPEPVAATIRYPLIAASREEEWQQTVVEHLGLSDWWRWTLDDEGDLVGPLSQEVMRRHGLPYPYNLHLLSPLIEAARKGSLVTGLGGDEVLTPPSRPMAVLAGHVRPVPRDALRLGAAIAPRFLRRAYLARRPGLAFPWLSDVARHELAAAGHAETVRLPLRWNKRMRELWRSRYLHFTIRTISRLASHSDVVAQHPFADARFIGALAREGGVSGFPSRAAAMHTLFGDALPSDVTRRASKASFNGVLWNRHSKAFVESLHPSELDRTLAELGLEEIVDSRALAVHWAGEEPLANSFVLLQACWLALNE